MKFKGKSATPTEKRDPKVFIGQRERENRKSKSGLMGTGRDAPNTQERL